MFQLPRECLTTIYTFDDTFKDQFKRVVLKELVQWVNAKYKDKILEDFGYIGKYRCSFYDDIDLLVQPNGERFVFFGDGSHRHAEIHNMVQYPSFDRYMMLLQTFKTSCASDIVKMMHNRRSN